MANDVQVTAESDIREQAAEHTLALLLAQAR